VCSARGKDDDKAARRQRYKQSILDFVGEDARQLKSRLGEPDRRKLDEYLTGVREIEQRLDRVEKTADLAAPAGSARPTGVPKDYREHLHLMADMLVLAFQADLTRVATFVFANDGSNRSYRDYGVSEGHHDMSHHGGSKDKKSKVQKINRFHIEQLAYLLGKLKSIREGNGTLLDSCMVVYGSGLSVPYRHLAASWCRTPVMKTFQFPADPGLSASGSATLLRPVVLAVYSAWSASRISSTSRWPWAG